MNPFTPNRAFLVYAVLSCYIFYNNGLSNGLLPFTIVTVLLLAYILYYTTSFKATEDFFEQNTVRVEFKTGSLIINGTKYNVNQVRGINIQRKGNIKITVSIELDDFKTPIQRVNFMRYSTAEKFMQRFTTALRKSNGPNLV
jgi:hypothetical protein